MTFWPPSNPKNVIEGSEAYFLKMSNDDIMKAESGMVDTIRKYEADQSEFAKLDEELSAHFEEAMKLERIHINTEERCATFDNFLLHSHKNNLPFWKGEVIVAGTNRINLFAEVKNSVCKYELSDQIKLSLLPPHSKAKHPASSSSSSRSIN